MPKIDLVNLFKGMLMGKPRPAAAETDPSEAVELTDADIVDEGLTLVPKGTTARDLEAERARETEAGPEARRLHANPEENDPSAVETHIQDLSEYEDPEAPKES